MELELFALLYVSRKVVAFDPICSFCDLSCQHPNTASGSYLSKLEIKLVFSRMIWNAYNSYIVVH